MSVHSTILPSVHTSICLSVCPFVRPNGRLYHPFILRFVSTSVRSFLRPSDPPILSICILIRSPSVRLSIHRSVGPTFCLSIVRPSVCLSVHPSVCQSIRQSVRPSVDRPSVHLTVLPSVHTSICLSVRSSGHPTVRPYVVPTVRSVCSFGRPTARLCFYIHPFVRLSSWPIPFVHPAVRPSVRRCAFVCWLVRPSVNLSVRPPDRPSIHLVILQISTYLLQVSVRPLVHPAVLGSIRQSLRQSARLS